MKHHAIGSAASRTGHRVWAWMLGLACVIALGVGVCLVVVGMRGQVVESMPLPEQEFANQRCESVSSVQRASVSVSNADHGGGNRGWDDPSVTSSVSEMSVDQMEPGSVFVPSIGAYLLVRSDGAFEHSEYPGFDSLRIPKNPHRGVVFAGGAGLTGGDAGTTLVASHISYGRTLGALQRLYEVSPCAVVVTKDESGSVAMWRVTGLMVRSHTDFPQEFFASDGQRQLVLTTCGGSMNSAGIYKDNIFAVASRVDNSKLSYPL